MPAATRPASKPNIVLTLDGYPHIMEERKGEKRRDGAVYDLGTPDPYAPPT